MKRKTLFSSRSILSVLIVIGVLPFIFAEEYIVNEEDGLKKVYLELQDDTDLDIQSGQKSSTILYLTNETNTTSRKFNSDSQQTSQGGSLNPQLQANGEIVLIPDNETNTTGIYLELVETNKRLIDGVEINISTLLQGRAVIGNQVQWFQNMTLINTRNKTSELKINLWDYDPDIDTAFIQQVLSYKINQGNETISETPIALITIKPYETIVLEIEYTTGEAKVEKECVEQKLIDFIPEDAIIISSDLPLITPIKEKCTLKITHDTLQYDNLEVPLDRIEESEIESVYFLEAGVELPVENGVIVVPRIS